MNAVTTQDHVSDIANSNEVSSGMTRKSTNLNSSTENTITSNDDNLSVLNNNTHHNSSMPRTNINANLLLLQSERTEGKNSLDEVDPKSLLANRTIFKTDNPNLSIIEINENSFKYQQEQPVLVIGSSLDKNMPQVKESKEYLNLKDNKASSSIAFDNMDYKRDRKAETLLHCGKQSLNVDIAEASAAEYQKENNLDAVATTKTVVAQLDLPQTKREIKIYDTLEEFEEHLPPTVTTLNTPFGSKVYLVGTAHFSEESQDDVSYVIRNVRPDVVMVELCPSRIHILKLDEKTLLDEAKSFNLSKIRDIIQLHGYINGIFFILLLQISAQIAKDLGMAPGGEFRRAFEEVRRLPGCMLHLGDRPIRITLNRALSALSMWQTMKLVWRLASTDTISIEEVEECKQRDLLEKLMQEMAGEFPAFSDVFVKERDMFLCHSLQMAAQAGITRPVRVVGVVGIGHAKGIAQMWGRIDQSKLPSILEIPPASRSTRVCKFTIKYGVIGLTLYGVFKLLRPRVMRLF